MRLRRRYIVSAALLGMLLAALPALASEPSPTVKAENIGGIYGEEHRWTPPQVTVGTSGAVTFSNPTEVRHGVHWIGGPGTPTCDNGVPVGTTEAASGTKWSGACKFTQSGTYTFYCTVHGAAMSGTVTVTNGEPAATTETATSLTEHEATLNGTVNPEGKATEYFFRWGTTASYGHETSVQHAGEGTTDVPVSAMLSGLAPGTPYHFELVAKNSSGEVHGADQIFRTSSPPGAPAATTGGATSVAETGATLNGTANPDGRPTKYFFEWGTSNAYGQMTAEVPVGEDHTGHVASATLTGLSPGMVYHFRLVARNTSSETVSGGDQMFTTASPSPPPPPPPPPPAPTATTPLTTPIVTTPAPASEEGRPLGSPVRLAASQHGSSVGGAVEISQADVGGRLEVVLLASNASLAKVKHSSKVNIGRLLRPSLKAGEVSFTVPLTVKAKSALRRHHHLALTARIVLTPVHGAAVTVTKSVVLHA